MSRRLSVLIVVGLLSALPGGGTATAQSGTMTQCQAMYLEFDGSYFRETSREDVAMDETGRMLVEVQRFEQDFGGTRAMVRAPNGAKLEHPLDSPTPYGEELTEILESCSGMRLDHLSWSCEPGCGGAALLPGREVAVTKPLAGTSITFHAYFRN